MDEFGDPTEQNASRAVRLLLILVAITAVLSLLYGIQYYAGGPIRLPVVTELLDLALSPRGTPLPRGTVAGLEQVPVDKQLSPLCTSPVPASNKPLSSLAKGPAPVARDLPPVQPQTGWVRDLYQPTPGGGVLTSA